VHLGGEGALRSRRAELVDVCLAEGVALPLRASVKVRYSRESDGAQVFAAASGEPRRAEIVFDAPVRAITRGQVAVFYDGDRVLGGGRIAAVEAIATGAMGATDATGADATGATGAAAPAGIGEHEPDQAPPLALRS
jgi:tRNA-uridine 2-sulfurtransferase